jgi:hypothetical protein
MLYLAIHFMLLRPFSFLVIKQKIIFELVRKAQDEEEVHTELELLMVDMSIDLDDLSEVNPISVESKNSTIVSFERSLQNKCQAEQRQKLGRKRLNGPPTKLGLMLSTRQSSINKGYFHHIDQFPLQP